jgi:hypothetical protein
MNRWISGSGRPVAVAAIFVFGFCGSTWGQSTAITYQGQLKQRGVPLSETVDIRFSLFDADVSTEPVAGPIVFDGQSTNPLPVNVNNGLFSVELDFGSEAYQKGGQWLQIEVRVPHDAKDIGSYTALTPRQKLTAAPIALSMPGLAAADAGGVEVVGDVHAAGEVIASAFSSNSPLIFKVNPQNVECARFDDANCYFGVGTAAPQARLHIGGVAGVDGLMFPDGSLMTTAAGIGGGDGFWSAGGANIFNNNGGNISIGTTDPNHRLRISGGPIWTTNGWTGSLELDNAAALGWRRNAAGLSFGIGQSTGGLYFFRTTSNPGTATSAANYDLVIGDSGNVGIGTPFPQAKLHITYPDSVSHRIEAGGGTNAWSRVEFRNGDGQWDVGTSRNFNGNQLYFYRQGSPAIAFGIQPNGDASLQGNLGVGVGASTRRLHVGSGDIFTARFEGNHTNAAVTEFRSASSNNTWEYGVTGATPPFGLGAGDLYFYRQGNSEPGITLSRDNFAATIRCADLKIGHAGRRGTPGRALVDLGDHLVVNFAADWGYTFVHGRLKCGVLEVAGADVAEKFPSSDEKPEPGTVMEIDPNNAGRLRVAREAYSSRVAGVVSGAGGLPAGAVLGNFPGSEDAPAIALSGRVWVKCDASGHAIAPGDLLTSAETPGHAMKAADRERSHGAVLGKAMTALSQGERGLVLVLVNLQ